MQKLPLTGSWQLSKNAQTPIPGHLPGSTYLDHINNGMADPFWGTNETQATELSKNNFTYSRHFTIPPGFLDTENIELVADGLDTLCTVAINGRELGKTNNIYRTWRFNAESFLNEGDNFIELKIQNPFPYMEEQHENEPLSSAMAKVKGKAHLRKTPCHFGWDWGPVLPPAGLIGSIALESYNLRISDIKIRQHHSKGEVELEVNAKLSKPRIIENVELTAPTGEVFSHKLTASGDNLHCRFKVDNPQLWWCNGLGDQPLYQLKIGDIQKQIGLRTIELDTTPDEYGAQFRFIINGVPIFARGANWIPADSFITRVSRADIDFYCKSAVRANMNMLRVWGGGMYESEDFYDACDQNGILVWQDFIFACSAYPFHRPEFLENVREEVKDNVRRLRHRASLALWCGNNENELFAKLWKKSSKERTSNPHFYHNILRGWLSELDDITPYWPGSPSSGSPEHKLHSMEKGHIRGDTHLWQVWHGMMPIEVLRKYPTRFCSEYGVESMPSMHTVRSFTDKPSPNLFDPVMQLHQKSRGGNEKILFYLLAKYRNPANFEDFVYLSQIVQSNAIRFATDCWRRNIGISNGALFWQMNDCWPVASWSGIDYHKQLKAVTYHARHFNKMLCLSNDYFDDRAELYVTNEYPSDFYGTLEWSLVDFEGTEINSGSVEVFCGGVKSTCGLVLRYSDVLKGRKKKEAALIVRLMQNEKSLPADEKYWLLVADKNAKLPKAQVKAVCVQNKVTLTSSSYARYVYLEAEGVTAPWSDNFFDIPAGREVVVTVELPEGFDNLQKKLKIKTLTDVVPKNSKLMDSLLRVKMVLQKKNFLSWLIFKFI